VPRFVTGRDQPVAGSHFGASPLKSSTRRKVIHGHSLFPEDRRAAVTSDSSIVQLRLSEMVVPAAAMGACWLDGQLWAELQLYRFWSDRLPLNRKGTRWDQTFIAPDSERKLQRDRFGRSARADLLICLS
jgi:hypothetical protein